MRAPAACLAALALLLVPGSATAKPRCLGERATVVVDDAAGYGRGTKGEDVIVVRAQVPVVEALGGDDLICNRRGAVQILDDGPGDDVVDAGPGSAFAGGSGGDDVIRGGRGGDNFFDGPGNDTYRGGGGHDVLDFGFSDAPVRANLGEGIAIAGDRVDALAGIESLLGSPFDDLLVGHGRKDFIAGGRGDDTILGLLGNDSLLGGDGRDTVAGGGGRDRCEGDELSSCERRFPPPIGVPPPPVPAPHG